MMGVIFLQAVIVLNYALMAATCVAVAGGVRATWRSRDRLRPRFPRWAIFAIYSVFAICLVEAVALQVLEP
jgi:hypothetical protein